MKSVIHDKVSQAVVVDGAFSGRGDKPGLPHDILTRSKTNRGKGERGPSMYEGRKVGTSSESEVGSQQDQFGTQLQLLNRIIVD